MPTIHFVNGMKQAIPEENWNGFLKRWNNSGLKYYIDRINGNIIPFDSPSIAIVEREKPDEPTEEVRQELPKAEETESDEEDESAEEVPEVTAQEKAEAALAEMKAKSECGMNKHTGQKQIIYKQAFKAAKGGKVYYKYYPICSFCGEKGRFIAADKLPDDVKEAALDHVEE